MTIREKIIKIIYPDGLTEPNSNIYEWIRSLEEKKLDQLTNLVAEAEKEAKIKLPHIQEFYDWCAEEDIDEKTMYLIAGWLGSEIYMQDAFIKEAQLRKDK